MANRTPLTLLQTWRRWNKSEHQTQQTFSLRLISCQRDY